MDRWWYVSALGWTCAVRTEAGKPFTILETPPILARFRGQPLRNLIRWMRRDPDWQLSTYHPPAGVDPTPPDGPWVGQVER